jgi:hypothetical protein
MAKIIQLKATVGGTPPVAIQWYEDDVLMPGETNALLSITPDPDKWYHITATNDCGTATSSKTRGDCTPE